MCAAVTEKRWASDASDAGEKCPMPDVIKKYERAEIYDRIKTVCPARETW